MTGQEVTTITLNTKGVPEDTTAKLLRALGELMEGQAQFVLLRRSLPKDIVMKVQDMYCHTPESAMHTIKMLGNWPRR